MEPPECPVCFDDTFTEPVNLSCGHIVCWPCLGENRNSGAETALLCPHSLCEYERATPTFLSGSQMMSPTQLQANGPRRPTEYPPPPHVTPPPSPSISQRRSTRVGRGTPGGRFNDFVTLPIPSRSRSGGNGSRSTGRQVEFMDDLSDGEQSEIAEPEHPVYLEEEDVAVIVADALTEGEGVEAQVPRGSYFKTYTLIEGCQKTHDTAILETTLELMTSKQIRKDKLIMTQLVRDIRAKWSRSFPGHPTKDISKLVKRSLKKSVDTFKKKEAQSRLSGRTRPPYSSDENLVSQILSLDDSLRLNAQPSARQNRAPPVNVVETDSAPRILTSTERSSVASDLDLSSPIVVNRRRQDQDAGRENRESSLAAHARRPRQGHPRLESSLSNLVGIASDARSSSFEANDTMAIAVDNRQVLNERRFEDDRWQRALDREEKHKDREEARERTRESNLLFAGVLSRLIPGSSNGNVDSDASRVAANRQVDIQYYPETGSEPFPLTVTITTLQALLSDLKQYTGISEVNGIALEKEGESPKLISSIVHLDFVSDTIDLQLVKKGGKFYFKLSP